MKDYFKFFDKLTFLLMVGLSVMGIFFIYSAGRPLQQPYYLKQMLWLFVSLLAFFVVFSIKIEKLFQYGFLLLLLLVILLFVQVLLGKTTAGVRSWFRVGMFNIQFSEFVKVPLALYLAKFITTFEVIHWKLLLKILAIIGIPVVLISVQPDLGVSFILCSFLVMILLLKKFRAAIVVIALLLAASLVLSGWNFLLKPYQKNRIVSFFNPEKFKATTGYHVIQSKIAIGSGGLAGKGYLKGSQSQYQFLPTRHTDFIVSVIGEEFGFLNIGLMFFVYFVFFYRQFKFKFLNDEEFYFVYLFNGLILFQFVVNVSMAIGLFPVLGITLPFISYGGSSLLSLFIGEAIIFRIKINNYIT